MHAAKKILQFAASHLADSLEAAENDGDNDTKKEREPVDTSWISLDVVHTILRRVSSSERERNSTRKEESRTSKYGVQIEAAKNMSHRLWSLPEDWHLPQGCYNKDGCVAPQPRGRNCGDRQENDEPGSDPEKDAIVYYYTGLTKKKAETWLRKIQAPTRNHIPQHTRVAQNVACNEH